MISPGRIGPAADITRLAKVANVLVGSLTGGQYGFKTQQGTNQQAPAVGVLLPGIKIVSNPIRHLLLL